MFSFKRSSALKGNKNAAGPRKGSGALAVGHGAGGATAGTIGGLFGPVGSFAGGYVAGSSARHTIGTPNQAAGERQTRRARRASAVVGGIGVGIHGAIAGGLVGAANAGVAATTIRGAQVGMKVSGQRGAIIGGLAGFAAGAAVNYGASRLGARAAGAPKSLYNKKKK